MMSSSAAHILPSTTHPCIIFLSISLSLYTHLNLVYYYLPHSPSQTRAIDTEMDKMNGKICSHSASNGVVELEKWLLSPHSEVVKVFFLFRFVVAF